MAWYAAPDLSFMMATIQIIVIPVNAKYLEISIIVIRVFVEKDFKTFNLCDRLKLSNFVFLFSNLDTDSINGGKNMTSLIV